MRPSRTKIIQWLRTPKYLITVAGAVREFSLQLTVAVRVTRFPFNLGDLKAKQQGTLHVGDCTRLLCAFVVRVCARAVCAARGGNILKCLKLRSSASVWQSMPSPDLPEIS